MEETKGWWTARYNRVYDDTDKEVDQKCWQDTEKRQGIIGANFEEVLLWAANETRECQDELPKCEWPFLVRFVAEGVNPRDLVFDDYYELGGGLFDELAPYERRTGPTPDYTAAAFMFKWWNGLPYMGRADCWQDLRNGQCPSKFNVRLKVLL